MFCNVLFLFSLVNRFPVRIPFGNACTNDLKLSALLWWITPKPPGHQPSWGWMSGCWQQCLADLAGSASQGITIIGCYRKQVDWNGRKAQDVTLWTFLFQLELNNCQLSNQLLANLRWPQIRAKYTGGLCCMLSDWTSYCVLTDQKGLIAMLLSAPVAASSNARHRTLSQVMAVQAPSKDFRFKV